LIFFGANLGHTRKLSHFLAGWFIFNWRNNIFVIDLLKTILFVRIGLRMARGVARGCRAFWFVTMNDRYAPFLVRFSSICGESFNVYEWTGGSLSNYRMILGWLSILIYILIINKYKIRNLDKRVLVALVGYLNKKLYNKIFVKRFNRTLGRHMNRWGRSYNSRKLIKQIRFAKVNREINTMDRSQTLDTPSENHLVDYFKKVREFRILRGKTGKKQKKVFYDKFSLLVKDELFFQEVELKKKLRLRNFNRKKNYKSLVEKIKANPLWIVDLYRIKDTYIGKKRYIARDKRTMGLSYKNYWLHWLKLKRRKQLYSKLFLIINYISFRRKYLNLYLENFNVK